MENDHHAMALHKASVMLHVKLVEEKKSPTEGARISLEFELETGSKIASFFL